MRANTSHPSNHSQDCNDAWFSHASSCICRKGELSGINASVVDVSMFDTTQQVNSALSGPDGTGPRFSKPICLLNPCNDPACRLDHPLVCDRCQREIAEDELELTGRFGDVPLHTDCAIQRYGER